MIQKYKLVISCFLFTLFTSNVYSSSYNLLGQTGLINIPSAEINSEQSVFFTFNRSDYIKLGTITVTPFEWLEASYFYYRPDDLRWGSATGLYLDKGFNVKFSYRPRNEIFPRIALGLDDFAGTGQFTREYIVSTYDFNAFKLTTGFGWGKYVGTFSTKNPLSIISNKFSQRPQIDAGLGGQPSYNLWFRGPSTPLLGIEYKLKKNKNFSIKLENDQFDYFKFGCCGEGLSKESLLVRAKDKDFNIGLSYKYKDIGNINFSYVKGNSFNLSFSVGLIGSKNYRKKNTFKPEIENVKYDQAVNKNEFYLDLLHNLNRNKLLLQTANLEEDKLNLTLESVEHFNPIIYSSRAAYIANEVAKFNNIELNSIETGHINRGIKINSIKFITEDLNLTKRRPDILVKRNSNISNSMNQSHLDHEFKPTVNFPVFLNNFSPDIKTHVGSPEQFIYTGIGIKTATEIQFNRNLVFYSVIGKSFTDNFDEKINDPNSRLQKVRTEVVKYLQEGSNDIYVTNMAIEYISSPSNNFYSKVAFGYLESMYGGLATEILYKPFDSNFAISYEYNYVKQRSFDQKFSFRKYKVSTNHLNIAHYHPKTNILTKWSYGNYLAGDKGYTLDLSRRMPNGWQAGIWFSRTNVSAELFGEGSFDKGFYINIPLNIFTKNYSKDVQGFKLRTMTRDGGQRLELENRLIDSFYGAGFNEINENWKNYLD